MSAGSKSLIREAWMAAPRAERSEGLSAVGDVEGDRIEVVGGKRAERRRAMTGVCDVPPERITWHKWLAGRGVGRKGCLLRRCLGCRGRLFGRLLLLDA